MRKQFGHPSKGGEPAEHQAAQRGESQEVVDYIRNSAKRAGIDPNQALRVAQTEGLRGFDPATGKWSSGPNDAGTSFGPFQAHFKSNIPGFRAAGQGDDMLKAGIDARKMGDWKKAVDWQLDYAHKHGWGEWHGWTGDRWAGINRGAVPEGGGRTAEQHQALVETAKRVNPATLGALGKPGAESAEAGAGYGQGTPPPLKVTGAQMAGVDPKMVEAVTAGASHMPKGYSVEIFSGKRGGTDPHGHGEAIDVRIRKPDGTLIRDHGADTTGMYQRLAQLTYGEIKARHPELANRYAWGGSFETSRGSGVPDLMHHDLMGRRGGIRPGMHPQIQALGAIPLAPERPAELAKKPPADIHQRARSMFGHPHMQSADLLGNARKAGMMGSQSQKVTGEASMRIDLRGFPKGTKTKTEMSGMFSQIRVARGEPCRLQIRIVDHDVLNSRGLRTLAPP
jgi:hypothetical protein